MSDKNHLLFIHYCFFAGTLILKIPWKNLYKEPLEVVIEDLFAIAGPNAGMKYVHVCLHNSVTAGSCSCSHNHLQNYRSLTYKITVTLH